MVVAIVFAVAFAFEVVVSCGGSGVGLLLRVTRADTRLRPWLDGGGGDVCIWFPLAMLMM